MDLWYMEDKTDKTAIVKNTIDTVIWHGQPFPSKKDHSHKLQFHQQQLIPQQTMNLLGIVLEF
jgi:hypothetical protein